VIVQQGVKWRYCVDCSVALNQFTPKLPFSCPRVLDPCEDLQPGDWMAKDDLSDAFFNLCISPAHQHLFGLRVPSEDGQGEIYLCQRIIFGWSASPYFYVRLGEKLAELTRAAGFNCTIGYRSVVKDADGNLVSEVLSQTPGSLEGLPKGFQLYVYIDDVFYFEHTQERVLEAVAFFQTLCKSINIIVAMDKHGDERLLIFGCKAGSRTEPIGRMLAERMVRRLGREGYGRAWRIWPGVACV